MTDKEFKRLKRSDLLDIILELQKKNREQEERISTLEQQLSSRELKLEKAGSIAEAALAVNGVMEAAQAAADQYLEQLRLLYERTKASADALPKDGGQAADEPLRNADAECGSVPAGLQPKKE